MNEDLAAGLFAVLKFVSIALTGVFGCLGLLTTFRDKDTGKPTKWGRIALIGIISSTVAAAGSQAIELWRAGNSAKKQSDQIASQLHEIQRAVEPLDSLTFTFWMKVNFDDPVFSSYRERLKGQVRHFLEQPDRDIVPGMRVLRYSPKNGPETVSIGIDSPAFPRERDPKEKAAYYALRYPDFDFGANAKPVQLVEGARPAKPDFEAGGINSNYPIDLEYDVKADSLEISAFNSISDPKFWSSNGLISSTLDFAEAQVIVHMGTGAGTGDNKYDWDILRVHQGMSIKALIVGLPRGREFWLRSETMHQVHDDRGLIIAERVLPEDFQSLH